MINALKNHPSFFRPASRPSSPGPQPPSRPESAAATERVARPLNKLSLSTFRRPSPAQNNTAQTAPLIQDGSYLEMLGLKLSEAVSKSLAQPTGPAVINDCVGGRRPIPAGRGHALGELIASELKATVDNAHLHRAILRSLHRPLSVLLTNLSAHLLPLISSPAFNNPPAPTPQFPNPNPTQLHALAISTFAGELLQVFDDLGLGIDADARGDGLKSIREGLVSLVNRVVNPLVSGIKNALIPVVEALEVPNSQIGGKPLAGTRSATVQHPSITTLQNTMPIYARALSRYITSPTSQTTLAAFLISIIWKCLVALSHRPYVPPSPPASPALVPVPVKRRRPSPSSSEPNTPPAGRFTMKLPPSRPPSPPAPQTYSSAGSDARALYDLLNLLPRPTLVDKDTSRLAKEAVDEAFIGLKALPALFDHVHIPSLKGDENTDEFQHALEVLTADVPTLIVLPILLHVYGAGDGVVSVGTSSISVAAILGLEEVEYRRGCLAGFGRAEECAALVGNRVLDALHAESSAGGIVTRWLEAELLEYASH